MVVALLGMGPAEAPALRDLIWTDASIDRAHALTHPPGECLRQPTDAAIETGRALFRSRALLGGPAARVGLSCESCHTNGRTNAHFLLPELTNRAGSADVTSEWASKVRGDGMMNPRPIPDLAGVAARVTFGSNRDPSLSHFVDSVIEDEFQGPAPPDGARRALMAYLFALDPAACPTQPAPVRIAGLAQDVRRALGAATADAQAGDGETAELTLLAAQDEIARLVERLPATRFARDRARLEALSRELGDARAHPLAIVLAAIAPSWNARFDAVVRRLSARSSRAYADDRTLRAALAR